MGPGGSTLALVSASWVGVELPHNGDATEDDDVVVIADGMRVCPPHRLPTRTKQGPTVILPCLGFTFWRVVNTGAGNGRPTGRACSVASNTSAGSHHVVLDEAESVCNRCGIGHPSSDSSRSQSVSTGTETC